MEIRTIVMVDQDGVMCNRLYQSTADVSLLIRTIQEQGTLIVPNSDTPVQRLARNTMVFLGFIPEVIIAEGGAVVVNGPLKTYTTDVRGIAEFKESLKQRFWMEDVVIEEGDSATWMREKKKFSPNSRLLVIDGLREQSLGFYLKTTGLDGLPVDDLDWMRLGLSWVKEIPLPAGLLPWEPNPQYCIAIARAVGATKTGGCAVLRQMYPGATIYMIGDGEADVLSDEGVIHCAVHNAVPRLKEHARFVSRLDVTQGLEECLRWISVNNL